MRDVITALLALALAGCAQFDLSRMTPEQLREYAKMKDASIACVIANSPYGKGTGLYVNLDKAVIPAGSLTVDDACKVTIITGPAARP